MPDWDTINHLLTAQSELAKAKADLNEYTYEHAAVSEAMTNITHVLRVIEQGKVRG